jgi:Bacterial protein of unknown function (DUF899)/SnoaL-like polyketide cyclase
MSDANKRITRGVLEELFEKGNLEATEDLIHPQFINHEAPPDNPQGPDGLKETVSWLRGIWGPMRAEIEDEICEEDEERQAARDALLEREKELTPRNDELARERRQLPWLPIERTWTLYFVTGRAAPPTPAGRVGGLTMSGVAGARLGRHEETSRR